MAERQSALAGGWLPEIPGGERQSGAGIVMREVPNLRLLQVAAWPGTLAAVGGRLGAAAGSVAPGPLRWVRWGEAGRLVRVEPLRWWLLWAGADDKLPNPALPELDSETAVCLDLSHSRTWIELGGAAVPDLLCRFLSIDFRPARFPAGAAASGRFGHVSATVLRGGGSGELWDLLLPRSYAAFCWAELVDAAGQFGLEIEG